MIYIDVLFSLTMSHFYQPKTLARHCIESHNFQSLKILVSNGCSTSSLLTTSMACSFKECFDFLLRQNVNLNELTPKGLSPLNFAVNIKHRYFVSQLLEKGADASIPDADGRLPIFHATDLGCEEIVKLLLDNGSPTCYLDSKNLPVVAAVERNHVRILSLLIQSGADPNGTGSDRRPLEIAAIRGMKLAVKLLLAAGADATGIDVHSFSKTIRNLFTLWDVEPRGSSMEGLVLNNRSQFAELKSMCLDFLEQSEKPTFLDGFLTPVIGGINDLVVQITQHAMSMEYTARQLKQARLDLLTKQFKYLEEAEKRKLNERFRKDEEKWALLVAETHRVLRNSVVPEQFVKEIVQFEERSKIERILSEDGDLSISFKENRGELLILNGNLAEFKKDATECHQILEQVSERIINILNRIDEIITEMLRLINGQQQMNFEFEALRKGTSVSQAVEDHLEDRRSTLNTDKAFIASEKKKFAQHIQNVMRMIRHCTN